MTEQRSLEQFETRLAGRVRTFTDPATLREIDPLGVSRTAMSSQRPTGWSQGRLGAGLLGRRIAGVRWAAAFVTVLLIGIVGVAVLGRPSDSRIGPQPTPATSSTPSPAASAVGPVPDVLRHPWQRPLPVTPDLGRWGTGFLSLASGLLDFGPAPGAAASRSAITAAGLDTLVVTATVETGGCAIGDIGAYRWSLEGKGTMMTLTAIGADACAAREEALAGPWVRTDLALPGDGGATASAGGSIPEALRHIWISGTAPAAFSGHSSLDLTSGLTAWDPETSWTIGAVASTGPDTLVFTSTFDSTCASGDAGTYRWSLSREGRLLTLKSIGDDACAARAAVLPGVRLRSECDEYACPGLPAGTHETTFFSPFGQPGTYGQMSLTVPDGYAVNHDWYERYWLVPPPDRPGPPPIFLFAQPRMSSDYEVTDAGCVTRDAPGVGHAVDDIVAAIRARPSLISTAPRPVTVGGYEGQMLDLTLAPSWTATCPIQGPSIQVPEPETTGPIAAVLRYAGAETGLEASIPIAVGGGWRLILLDLSGGKTMAIIIPIDDSPGAPRFEELVAPAMPIMEGFKFHPPTP
jgi:hypothetical protein